MKWIFDHTILIGTRFFIKLFTRSKHIIINLIILQLQIQISDNLVGVLYFFMVCLDFDIHFLSHFNELFYFRKIFSPGRSLRKKSLKFKIFTLNSGNLLLMEFFHLIKFFVHVLGMLQSVFLNLSDFFMGLLFCFVDI